MFCPSPSCIRASIAMKADVSFVLLEKNSVCSSDLKVMDREGWNVTAVFPHQALAQGGIEAPLLWAWQFYWEMEQYLYI